MKISLKPVGGLEPGLLEKLKARLEPVFGCQVQIKPGVEEISHMWDSRRKQYISSGLLSSLDELGKDKNEKVLGIADVDLYAQGLNFVFGEADLVTETAIVSLRRLRPEFYGAQPNEQLLMERALKEMVHELGHTFGLMHCLNPLCVMHFSNSLADTDVKKASFCKLCRPRLKL